MRKFYLVLALSLLTVFALSGCKSTTPPEDLQPVPEASQDPNGMGGYGAGSGTYGLDSTGGSGFGGGSEGKWQSEKEMARNSGADAEEALKQAADREESKEESAE